MTEAQKATLETKYMLVDSEFDDTFYAVDRKGEGMFIVSDGKAIPVRAENIAKFADELVSVWNIMKPRCRR